MGGTMNFCRCVNYSSPSGMICNYCGGVVPATLAATPEPAPTGDGTIVLDAVLAKIDQLSWHWTDEMRRTLPRVRADLVARAEFGLKKYGTKLRINNGRNATNDLYQEVLDAVMYAMQCRMEGKPAGSYVEALLNFAQLIATDLAKQEHNDKTSK